MIRSSLFLGLLGLLGLARASPARTHVGARDDSNSSQGATTAAPAQLLIGGGPSGSLLAASFSGSSFDITANSTFAGTDVSWLSVHPNNSNIYANDENSNATRVLRATCDSAGTISAFTVTQTINGSAGVVNFGINPAGTRMAGAGFGSGFLDFWDVSQDGSIKRIEPSLFSNDSLGPNTARQAAPHPHQVQIDPSGRFFVANDLGTDTVLVVDTKDDDFRFVNHFKVSPGCGPRHGVFLPPGAAQATHYVYVCEMLNTVNVLAVSYSDASMDFAAGQTQESWGAGGPPPANKTSAAAGEIQASADGKHVYVSNRLTGNDTDSIAHFEVAGSGADLTLRYCDTVSSGGLIPRMFSLSSDDGFVLVTNQDGESGLLALERSKDTGSLNPEPVAKVSLATFGASGFGPQFVLQI